ncbi:MAG: CHASE2 domain-containing protein [Gammaproteobacteria bacterium]|nr:CHASE2 domain-containing protein [Gammaproteobacteria bacterium]
MAIVVAFLMLAIMPKLMPSSDLMTHLTARSQAALVGSFYPIQQRDNVTVLLIDDKALADLEQGWPVPYATHARWLSNLGTLYQPRAVFLDITFTQARKDETLSQLVQALCRLRDQGVPVFLAALPDPQTGRLAVRRGLDSPAGERPCFTLVGVNYQPHQVDRLVWSYPLWTANQGAGSAMVDSRSGALAMAQDVAGLDVPRFDEPMALTWGVNNQDIRRFGEWCRFAGSVAEELIPPGLRALHAGEEVLKPICPYSRSLTVSELKPQTEEDEARLHALLNGKFVIMGAAISGTNDMITSPVHGPIPGVFMHAMALDNLLTYNGHYKRALEWQLPPAWPLFWMGLVVVLTAHALHMAVWQPLRKRTLACQKRIAERCPDSRQIFFSTSELSELESKTPFKKPYSAGFLRQMAAKLARLVGLVVLRVARIFVSSVVIMGLVVWMQKWFDIGTLPIVDLALMALVAEWLGWTAHVLDFFPWRNHTPSLQEK